MNLAAPAEVLELAKPPAIAFRVDTAGRQDVVERSQVRAWSLIDVAAAVAFAVGIAAAIWTLQRSMDPRFFTAPAGNDVWFEADVPTVADTVLHRWSQQTRNARHPLFPLLGTGSSYALRAAGLDDRSILAVLSAGAGALWVALFYVIARAVTKRRLDAFVFTALACSTSSAMFWMLIPETYTLASLSLLVPLALCVLDGEGRLRSGWYVAASAVSFSVTTTNWMSGMFAAAARWPWRRALQITANALCVVVVLWAVQRLIFPTAPFFFGYSNETRFILPPASGGPGPVARVLFFHSIVMPQIQLIPEPKWGTVMSVQHSAIGSSGPWGVAATTLWGALLAIAARGLLSSRGDARFRIVLASTLAGQVLLYMVYGEETFLYTLHVIPLLVLAAALAVATTSWRRTILVLAVALTFAAAVNNALQLATAMRFFSPASATVAHVPNTTFR
jgi:hypothetical protein